MTLLHRPVILLVTALLSALAFKALHLPAAWFFGALVVSAIFAVCDWHVTELPRAVFLAGQGVIGTALGAGFSLETLYNLGRHPIVSAFAVAFILLIGALNGWLLARFTQLDVATAFLGTMPGAATPLVAMSESLRADPRLVAVMQYTRMLLILISLALVTPILSHFSPSYVDQEPAITAAVLPANFVWWRLAILAVLACIGGFTGARGRIPAGAFLVPAVLYILLQLCGVQLGRLPWPVSATAYFVVGLHVGGRFRRSTIAAGRNILPAVCGTTLLLLAGSFVLAWILTLELGLDPVRAYLAATPVSIESVAAVAAELEGDAGIVFTFQFVRYLSVVMVAPWLVRACRRWLENTKVSSR
jgi:membrane AbrB-like protein